MNVKDLIAQAVKLEDQTKSVARKREIPPEGPAVCRFTGYVELGMQPQPDWNGKKKPPVDQVRLEFTLLNDANIREVQVDGNTVKIYDRVFLTMPKIMGDKSKFKKLFNKLANGRDITHISQLLGDAFQVKIRHAVSEKGNTYVSVQDDDGSYTFSPPYIEVPGKAEPIRLEVPEYSDLKMFIWENPTQESWNALFLPGTYEKDGKTYSKNFIQEQIMRATNFEGSALQQMLADASGSLNAVTNQMQDLSEFNP